jgi:hypothetical protein
LTGGSVGSVDAHLSDHPGLSEQVQAASRRSLARCKDTSSSGRLAGPPVEGFRELARTFCLAPRGFLRDDKQATSTLAFWRRRSCQRSLSDST